MRSITIEVMYALSENPRRFIFSRRSMAMGIYFVLFAEAERARSRVWKSPTCELMLESLASEGGASSISRYMLTAKSRAASVGIFKEVEQRERITGSVRAKSAGTPAVLAAR
jgi:hypothetical protein